MGDFLMDAASLKEKAALCLRIAKGLSWNNPGRLQLTDLAERLDVRQKIVNCFRQKRIAGQTQVRRANQSLLAAQRMRFVFRRGPAHDRHSAQSLLLNPRTVL
jgi:hypothetical protein